MYWSQWLGHQWVLTGIFLSNSCCWRPWNNWNVAPSVKLTTRTLTTHTLNTRTPIKPLAVSRCWISNYICQNWRWDCGMLKQKRGHIWISRCTVTTPATKKWVGIQGFILAIIILLMFSFPEFFIANKYLSSQLVFKHILLISVVTKIEISILNTHFSVSSRFIN